MAAATEDTKELEVTIKGLLISRPTVVNANVLQRECEQEIGRTFPFRQLGFPTFVDYLRSIPTVVQLEPPNGYNPDVYPIQSQASLHIDQLVSRQRVAPSRRRGVARRGAYNSRPAAVRRRTIRPVAPRPAPPVVRPNQVDQDTVEPQNLDRDITVQHLDPIFMRKILWDLVKKLAISWKTVPLARVNFDSPLLWACADHWGVDVRDLQNYLDNDYNKKDLQRNGIHSVDSLLSHAEGMVERGDTKVYPKLAGGSNDTGRSSTVNGIPAGLEDDFDDFDDEYEFYEEETGKDSEEELSKQAIQLWSRALGEGNEGSSPRSPKPGGETSAEVSAVYPGEEGFHQNVDLLEEDSNISSGMINNFRKILFQHPDGIWASQLQQLYFDQFRVSLDLMDLGHTSAISLVSSLPSVFAFRREGSHDWKLYDARYVTQESLDVQVNGGDVLSENGRYIPQNIIEKIKKLLEDHPNGFRSTDLLQLYRETFSKPLDLEILGFNTLEEFLMILKNDVTLKKALNYYLLLPKHKLMPHDALQPSKPDERLNLSAEALCVPIPENVLRLEEEIPLQELPPVEMDPDPDRPLLELEVRVAEVMSPVFFYMSLGTMYEELEKMMDDLEKFYLWEEANFKIPLPHIATNLYCAAKYAGFWHRAKITRIKSHGNVEIEFIDYGTPATVKSSELRYLSKEFAYLPAQAVCGKLMGVKPMNGETRFPPDVCSEFLNLVDGKRLVAHVYQVAARVRHRQERMQLDVILFDVENPNQEIVINDYLVENGLASPISQTQDSSSEVQQPVGNLLPESDLFSFQENGPSMALPSSSTSLPETSSSLLGNYPTSLQTSSLLGNPPTLHQTSSLFENATTSLQTSSVVTLLKNLLNDLTSNDTSPVPSPRIPSLSLRPNKTTQEQSKPRGPPPGFEKVKIDPDFKLSTSPVDASPTISQSNSQPYNSQANSQPYNSQANSQPYNSQPYNSQANSQPYNSQANRQPYNSQANSQPYNSQANSQPSNSQANSQPSNSQANSQPSNSMPTEEQQRILINNYYLMNPAQLYPQLLLQEQYHQQNVYRPNPSNMPLGGSPLFQYPQNGSQRSLTYGSVVPPQNAYHNPHSNTYRHQEYRAGPTISRNYVQMNPVPVIQQAHGGFVLMNAPVPNQFVQLHPPTMANRVSNASAKAQGYGQGDFMWIPQSVQAVRHQPSPVPAKATPTPPPATPRPGPSPAPAYTPITIPEWPLTNRPASFTSAPIGTKLASCSLHSPPASPKRFQSPEVTQAPRPGTPLTPASAEVANICKLSRTNSSTSHDSGRHSASSQNNRSPLDNTSRKSEIIISPLDNTSRKSEIIISPLDNTTSNTQVHQSSVENATSNFQNEKTEHDFRNNSDPPLDAKGYPQSHQEVNEPPDVVTMEIPLSPPSPEKLYSAISSPVDSLIRASPLKEELSDDYASASENVEEAKQQLTNLTLTELYSIPAAKPTCDPSEDIPDSWENLDLDDTPAKAANFSVDFSQPLDLILQNIDKESTVKANNSFEKSGLEVISQESPLKIQAPANWKDIFNPDIINNSERVDNNNVVKGKFPSPLKFNVKKVPVQEIEVQGKVFHLLYINNTPAVVALEFFKQFASNNNVAVSEKVVEVSHNKMYYISKAEHPAILTELNKKNEFWGGLQKKVVIRLNKVRVLNLSDIPQCLRVLNVPNKPLVDDLKKIANELASC